jgi:acyl-[acyl-carrier-protein]-phospholipid O-acyltransferase/long-chain-fatty-acid--[acyl-carrier-protein] ligase
MHERPLHRELPARPPFWIRLILWLATHTLYRLRVHGTENVPSRGPALLVCNHLSLGDGLLLQACLRRPIRFMVYDNIYKARGLRWFFKATRSIPISTKRGEVLESLKQAQEALKAGDLVCLFAEGGLSVNGNIGRFKRGMERLLEGVDVPLIPTHLDGLWGALFSFRNGRFSTKRPERIPYPAAVTFGPALPSDSTAAFTRRKVRELGAEAMARRLDAFPHLEKRFVRMAKRHFFGLALADTTGRKLSYGKTLGAALALGGLLKRRIPESHVGIMLPAGAAGALANLGAAFAGKVTVNLNFTSGPAAMRSAMEQCGARSILTSKLFLAKANLPAPDGAVFLEELLDARFRRATFLWWATAAALPSWLLVRALKNGPESPDDTVSVLFSSGSTGVPKGVPLTHRNLLANIEGVAQVLQVTPSDCMVGVLPFFHAYGYMASIWLPLDCGFKVVYHASPLEAENVGNLCAKYKGTILMATPTFMHAYTRRCTREQFSSLRYAVAGAEKLRPDQYDAFHERFGKELLEGYGCTEMAPVVSLNVPDVSLDRSIHVGHKRGTIGLPLPGVAAKIADIDSLEELEPGHTGLLLVKGPARTPGYLNRPDLSAEAFHDGWYITGDLASIDGDGFIELKDRLARFSKLGGEMVPHLAVEEALRPALAPDASCIVCSAPDAQKGERLVVLHTDASLDPAAAWAALQKSGLPRLWQPKQEYIFHVDAIPALGTGKTDLRGSTELARSLAAGLRPR